MKKLEIKNIKKSFKERAVVENVSLQVQAGEIVGLLGPNGAGKTTTFLMILGIHQPDRGRSGSTARRSPICRFTFAPAAASRFCPRNPRSSAA